MKRTKAAHLRIVETTDWEEAPPDYEQEHRQWVTVGCQNRTLEAVLWLALESLMVTGTRSTADETAFADNIRSLAEQLPESHRSSLLETLDNFTDLPF